MKRLLPLFIIVLAGCDSGGSDGPSTGSTGIGGTYTMPVVGETTYTYTSDQYGDMGVILQASANLVTDYSYIPFPEMVEIYRNVEMCVVNNKTSGPYIQFRSFEHMGLGGAWGVYAAGTLTTYINADEGLVPRSKISDRATLKHEFVHHILFMNGQDKSHANPAFVRCDALGTKVCDGKACE